MWFVVCTGKGKEKAAKNFLLNKVRGVREVYITPYRKVSHTDRHGQQVETVAPLLMNYVFVDIKVTKRPGSRFLGLRTNAGEKRMVFRQLAQSLSKGGYFTHQVRAYDRLTGEAVIQREKSDFHLLCANPANTPIEQIMEQSWVTDAAMNAFKVYNSQTLSSDNLLRIEPVAYSQLLKEHDVVQILRGQFAGQEGIVRRCHQGKKDRRFYIEFSSNLCLSISGIHQNDIAIVHEAVSGRNAKAVSLWRDIDAVIGSLQFGGHPDDAPKELRRQLKAFGQKLAVTIPGLSDAEKLKAEKENEKVAFCHKQEVLAGIRLQVRNIFEALGNYFNSTAGTDDRILREYIPNAPIRPFLTPTAGTEIGDEGYVILHHEGFDEYVVRKDLSAFFNTGIYDKAKYRPVFDEDYQYYAHVAVLNDRRTRKAIAPWGGFYDCFERLSIPQRKDLAQILLKRKYEKTFRLLRMDEYVGQEQHDKTEKTNATTPQTVITPTFESVHGIGGFSTPMGEEDDFQTVQRLIDAVVPAAVEIWQGTRLQEWRQLLQQYVLLHKVPVIDQPTVIADDEKLEALFKTKDADGNPDTEAINRGLNNYAQSAMDASSNGNLYQSAALFLKIAKYAGISFVVNELYNFLGKDGYKPDAICTRLYKEVIISIHDERIRKYLHRGYAELSRMDAWKYFHLPSFLKNVL